MECGNNCISTLPSTYGKRHCSARLNIYRLERSGNSQILKPEGILLLCKQQDMECGNNRVSTLPSTYGKGHRSVCLNIYIPERSGNSQILLTSLLVSTVMLTLQA
ncbi:hypothetical protein LguiA_033062 [Lonicera macranthoides]